MPSKFDSELNSAKLEHLQRAFDLISLEALAEQLAAYPNRVSDGKTRRAARTALKRYKDGGSGKMTEYDPSICRYAKDHGWYLPPGWSDSSCSVEHLKNRMHRIGDFPFTPFQSCLDFDFLCDVLFRDRSQLNAVYKLYRPSFDVEHALISELLYVSAAKRNQQDFVAFDYYFTSVQAPAEDMRVALPNNVTSVRINRDRIHRGSGTVCKFAQSMLWLGSHEGTEDDRLIGRPRILFLGPKSPDEPGRRAQFGLAMSQSKAFGYHPKSVRCAIERRDDLQFSPNDSDRLADVALHTTLSLVSDRSNVESLADSFSANNSADTEALWKSLCMSHNSNDCVMEAMCSDFNRIIANIGD